MKTIKVKCVTCNKQFEVYGKKFKPKVSKKLRKQGYKASSVIGGINSFFTRQLPSTHLPDHKCKQTKKDK